MAGLTDMKEWMGALPDHLWLNQISMPGSHDAGVFRDAAEEAGRFGKWFSLSRSITQDRSILDQCEAGSRFFDIRLNVDVSNSSIRAHHTTWGQGAVGESWDSTLECVSAFLEAHPSEFVILRLTKPTGGANDDIIENVVRSSLKDKLFKSTNFPNFAHLTIGSLRGKAICAFDPKEFSILHPSMGLHPFYRYEDGVAMGVITCGKYSNATKLAKVIDGQVEKIDAHANHKGRHLFVL